MFLSQKVIGATYISDVVFIVFAFSPAYLITSTIEMCLTPRTLHLRGRVLPVVQFCKWFNFASGSILQVVQFCKWFNLVSGSILQAVEYCKRFNIASGAMNVLTRTVSKVKTCLFYKIYSVPCNFIFTLVICLSFILLWTSTPGGMVKSKLQLWMQVKGSEEALVKEEDTTEVRLWLRKLKIKKN